MGIQVRWGLVSAVAALTTACAEPATVEPLASPLFNMSQPGFVFPAGCCYYNDRIVRTVVPPSAFPNAGRENFYAITNGVSGQKGVVATAPGDLNYTGGHWAFHAVTFTVAPYLLTSEAAVLAAQAAGDVTVTRVPANDFLCPIQP
jgi:hypothetical protein